MGFIYENYGLCNWIIYIRTWNNLSLEVLLEALSKKISHKFEATKKWKLHHLHFVFDECLLLTPTKENKLNICVIMRC